MKKILISGNEAIAEAAIQAGCRFYAGYPITPQNEIPAYMARRMPEENGIFVQAESEIAAVNMIFGASAAGARAMTSSSSPGISLKQEGISYLAGAELPVVIVNMMRGGPGLGNIAPAQADYFQATRSGGHGDYHCIVLAPATVQEAYNLMFCAFDLADQYRTPVIILGDGMLGQVMEPIQVTKSPGHKVTSKKKEWALTGCKGRAPNVVKSFYMREGDLEKFNLLLQKKYKLIRRREQRVEEIFCDDAAIIVVAYGTTARIARSAVNIFREKGKKVGLIRPITLWPFPENIFKRLLVKRGKLSRRPKLLVVEMSSGQMVEDVRLAVEGSLKVEFLGRAGGGIVTEEQIINKINRLLR